MLTRRSFIVTGAGALAVTATAGGALAGTSPAAAMRPLALASHGMAPLPGAEVLALGTDRLATLKVMRKTLAADPARPLALSLDAADAFLFEMASADLAFRPTLVPVGA